MSVQKHIELSFKLFYFVFEILSENGSALGGFRFFLVEFREHPLRPSGRQRNFLNLVRNLACQNFLTDIFLRALLIFLFGTAIVVMAFLRFGSDGAPALAALE